MTHVTIVMPVWRPRADWLTRAVESALAERACEVEVIVVDDGCDPPVDEILEVADPRVRLLRQDHRGVAAARNAGIGEARGAYLRFLDADDVAAPGSTGLLLGLARDSAVIAYGATAVCDEELHPTQLLVSDVDGWAEEACLLGRFEVRVVSMLFPRRVVERTGPWTEGFPISVDWDYVLRALGHAEVRGSRTVATYYRRHPASLTRTADIAAGERARELIVDGFFARHPEHAGTRLEREARAAIDIDRALAYAAAGRPSAAIRRVLRAATRTPRAALGPALWVARTAVAGTLSRHENG